MPGLEPREVHTLFTYAGGETFTFQGDDDVWVFINGQLVIDLGGVARKHVWLPPARWSRGTEQLDEWVDQPTLKRER